jgi:hypothetical protein
MNRRWADCEKGLSRMQKAADRITTRSEFEAVALENEQPALPPGVGSYIRERKTGCKP